MHASRLPDFVEIRGKYNKISPYPQFARIFMEMILFESHP